MGGLHEFERKLIRQRCDEGIKRATDRLSVRSQGTSGNECERPAFPWNEGPEGCRWNSIRTEILLCITDSGSATKGDDNP